MHPSRIAEFTGEFMFVRSLKMLSDGIEALQQKLMFEQPKVKSICEAFQTPLVHEHTIASIAMLCDSLGIPKSKIMKPDS